MSALLSPRESGGGLPVRRLQRRALLRLGAETRRHADLSAPAQCVVPELSQLDVPLGGLLLAST